MLPTSLGVNPQLTIMSLALRSAGFIDDRLGETSIEKQAATRLNRLRSRLRREKESMAQRDHDQEVGLFRGQTFPSSRRAR